MHINQRQSVAIVRTGEQRGESSDSQQKREAVERKGQSLKSSNLSPRSLSRIFASIHLFSLQHFKTSNLAQTFPGKNLKLKSKTQRVNVDQSAQSDIINCPLDLSCSLTNFRRRRPPPPSLVAQQQVAFETLRLQESTTR